jgi:hypothetical protein
MIEVVQSFRTSDGQLFDSREFAERHEAEIELENFVESECWRGMDIEDVLKFIVENKQRLTALLLEIQK